MKAVVFRKYGPPEVLRIQDVPKPAPKDNEVLVKIITTAVNDYDWSMIRGKPFLYRLMFGLFRPKRSIPGMEMAGIVESAGTNVSEFSIGDRVYGDTSDHGFGTYAEYMAIDQQALVKIPPNMSFEEATTISHAAMLAYQGLVEVGNLRDGMKILINGAGGGMGMFGLQIAKQYSTHVTGVDTGNKLDEMKRLGFDRVIDYKQTDFTKEGEKYDLIVDAKSTRSAKAYRRALTNEGLYVTVGGYLNRLMGLLFAQKLLGYKNIKIVALKPNKDLHHIHKLYEQGKIKCTIDGPYPLEKSAEAVRRFGEGKHTGKVVISVTRDLGLEIRD